MTGTGFFYEGLIGDPLDGTSYPILVTNRHVVSDIKTGTIRLIKSDGALPLIGQTVDVAFNESDWTFPSDADIDLAVMSVSGMFLHLASIGVPVITRTIGWDLIPSDEILEELDVFEPITFVGYPGNAYDAVNQTPIIRRGSTATPIQFNYNNKPIFLVDASIFPGSSGSPVFIIHQNGYTQGGTHRIGATRILFVGVIAAVSLQVGRARLVSEVPTGIEYDQMIDLGHVFNFKAVNEIVDTLCRNQKVSRTRPTALTLDMTTNNQN